MEITNEFIALCILLAGYIVGLGAVTVIDLHGFLGRTSSYWTEATTRTHKVTKPLIWIGLMLVAIGSTLWFADRAWWGLPAVIHGLYTLLLINGSYLSFVISPYLLAREARGEAGVLLPMKIQYPIMVSFVFSVLGWWGTFLLIVWDITQQLGN
jgi:hypothetical protein